MIREFSCGAHPLCRCGHAELERRRRYSGRCRPRPRLAGGRPALIVVDNASAPADRTILRAGLAADVTLVENAVNQGFAGGTNRGLEDGTGRMAMRRCSCSTTTPPSTTMPSPGCSPRWTSAPTWASSAPCSTTTARRPRSAQRGPSRPGAPHPHGHHSTASRRPRLAGGLHLRRGRADPRGDAPPRRAAGRGVLFQYRGRRFLPSRRAGRDTPRQ